MGKALNFFLKVYFENDPLVAVAVVAAPVEGEVLNRNISCKQ